MNRRLLATSSWLLAAAGIARIQGARSALLKQERRAGWPGSFVFITLRETAWFGSEVPVDFLHTHGHRLHYQG